MLQNKLNINLYGPNGSGKTRATYEVLNELKIPYFYSRITDFVDPPKILEKLKAFLIAQLTDNSDSTIYTSSDSENIFNTVLDQNMIKFVDLWELLEVAGELLRHSNFYIILDSIEDLKHLDAQFKFKKYFLKLIAICKNFDIKLILISNFDLKNSELFPEHDYLDSFIQLQTPRMCTREVIDKTFGLNKNRLDSLSEYCTNYAIGNYNSNIVNMNKLIINMQYFFEDIKKTDFYSSLKSRMTNVIKSQMINELYINQTSLFVNDEDRINLTESLSKCQKVIIISAFLAHVTPPTKDDKLFRVNKNYLKRKIYNSVSHSIESKIKSGFTISRLIAIYSSIYEIYNNKKLKKESLGVEFIADVNSLLQYKLLKRVNNEVGSLHFDLNSKLLCLAPFSMVEFLSLENNIRIQDFLENDINFY
jgi:hypothetical protein